ncbi:MAG TPA: type II toxin-antitoxin system VapC family toxin [Chthoniobacteraceae bacterium]|jgi:predicted nucleic acid-binding protein|nr:type II toxin-antitoxin system VapC family toxin [Chthoniobacteraceae bacterium]
MFVLIAVDTNVLIDHADGDEDVIGALDVIKERLPEARLIVTPTVLEELGYLCEHGEPEEAELAERALSSLLQWGYEPLNIIPAGRGITEQIGLKLRMRGIIPDEEENDAFIVAEAALLGCLILLSSDHHLLEAQEHPMFRNILREASVDGDQLVIATPRKIATQYFRRR